MQLSKTVYFPDHPLAPRSGLTVRFGNERDLFDAVAPLSSYSIRQLLGVSTYADVVAGAEKASLPTAMYLRTKLRERVDVRPLGSGLQATFRGGKGSPLHDWFPYLEGYSPDFVSSIIRTYAPEARSVLDPFCGSGTTALVAAGLGLKAFYCEVNPVCRAVIGAKVLAQSLAKPDRAAATEALLMLADTLGNELDKVSPAADLDAAAPGVFGKRPFFPEANYKDALRLRSLIDSIENERPRLAQFVTVAVLRSLVPSSNLVRRGDLRFRTAKELDGGVPRLRHLVRDSLRLVASDLVDLVANSGSVALLCESARDIDSTRDVRPDLILTSPPYLNGTNYFRNTKIELWFIRSLKCKADLRKFRDAAITAGINDVTGKKVGKNAAINASSRLRRVLEDLLEDAYDLRIPMMAAAYFNEMGQVIERLSSISEPNTTVAIDLGDSCYGDVWVPTDVIIGDLMVEHGFEPVDEVVLRERQSRDGRKLRQTLQVFKCRPTARAVAPVTHERSLGAWDAFKSELPHQTGDYAKRNWGHSWHSMCSYQGKLKPSIAHHLVEALMPKSSGRILDPFSGVGTIPFEARLSGHTAFAFDISPAAVHISRAKLGSLHVADVWSELHSLEEWIVSRSNDAVDEGAIKFVRFNGSLVSYFNHDTLREILSAREYFMRPEVLTTSARSLVLSALLHILHGNRPYALSRRSHPITPFAPTGPSEYRALIPRLTAKIMRLLKDPPGGSAPAGFVFDQDATSDWPHEVSDLDVIITSPPFFDSTRFYAANWMRLWFCGWEAGEFRAEPARFVDERQKVGFEVYEPIFKQAADRLKPGGYFALHLGKSSKCDMATELASLGSRYLSLIDVLDESVSHCESHGIRDKGAVTHHQYVLFRR